MIGGAELPIARIRELAGNAEFLAAMADFYRALDARIADRDPTCACRGDCCRFAEFGHYLYVTSAEVAFFLAENTPAKSPWPPPPPDGSCPFQHARMCTARQARPTGCRIFHCESSGHGWQEQLTEESLAELRELHQRFAMPYAYIEWLSALRQLSG